MKRFELLSIIGSVVAVGITLVAVVVGSIAGLRTEVRTDIAEVRTEMQTLRAEVNTGMQILRTEMQALRTEVRADIRALEHRLAAVERRQARTEGLLEGLRNAITARRGEDPPAREEST